MNILYEDSMPYAEHFLNGLGNAKSFSTGSLGEDDLRNIDVLLVRSTTKVNKTLLQKAKQLKYVATATAGSDHLDKTFLASIGLPWGSAAGCNAIAVAEYVLSCLMAQFQENLDELRNKTVGIVGAGHVGTALATRLKVLGIETNLCDPPLQEQGDTRPFYDLDEICQCDVISLHVPYVREGKFATGHLFDANRLSMLKDHQILINACRGEVVDNAAAKVRLGQANAPHMLFDVWESEPDIDFQLVPLTDVATAHIAGHSLEGKARGTYMLYQQICERFGYQQTLDFQSCLPVAPALSLPDAAKQSDLEQIYTAIMSTYNVTNDSRLFKDTVKTGSDFVYSRKHYAIRREFASVPLNAGNFSVSEALYELGFGAVK